MRLRAIGAALLIGGAVGCAAPPARDYGPYSYYGPYSGEGDGPAYAPSSLLAPLPEQREAKPASEASSRPTRPPVIGHESDTRESAERTS